mgnify:CR=1 FL=1
MHMKKMSTQQQTIIDSILHGRQKVNYSDC